MQQINYCSVIKKKKYLQYRVFAIAFYLKTKKYEQLNKPLFYKNNVFLYSSFFFFQPVQLLFCAITLLFRWLEWLIDAGRTFAVKSDGETMEKPRNYGSVGYVVTTTSDDFVRFLSPNHARHCWPSSREWAELATSWRLTTIQMNDKQ